MKHTEVCWPTISAQYFYDHCLNRHFVDPLFEHFNDDQNIDKTNSGHRLPTVDGFLNTTYEKIELKVNYFVHQPSYIGSKQVHTENPISFYYFDHLFEIIQEEIYLEVRFSGIQLKTP